MILTCPACDTSYFVPDEAIGPNGRRVRCKSCGHDWRASLEDAPLDLSALEAEAAQNVQSEPDPVPASLSETPAPELPRAFRAKAEQKRRLRQAATQGVAWVGLAVLLMALILSAVAFRLPIVKVWPQAAEVYKLIGFPVNVVGLEFEAKGGRVLAHDPSRVVIGGALRNIRDHEVVAPSVRIILKDPQGREVSRKLVRLDGPPILPGQVMGFAGILDNPDNRGVTMAYEFAVNEKAAPVAPKPEAKAVVHRPLPQADETGLRGATAFDTGEATTAPLDSKAH